MAEQESYAEKALEKAIGNALLTFRAEQLSVDDTVVWIMCLIAAYSRHVVQQVIYHMEAEEEILKPLTAPIISKVGDFVEKLAALK